MREIKVYLFEELSEEAKKYAVERYKYNHGDYLFDNWDARSLTDYFKEYVSTKYGYEDKDFFWSLSHSQGDGVRMEGKMYEGEVLYLAKRLMSEEEYREILDMTAKGYSLWGSIEGTSNRYYHYNTMKVELESDLSNLYDEAIDQLGIDRYNRLEGIIGLMEDCILEDIKDISEELESIGYKEIESHYTNEYVTELLVANEREFFEDGSLF